MAVPPVCGETIPCNELAFGDCTAYSYIGLQLHVLVEETPAFAANSRNKKLHIEASCAVDGLHCGQDGAVSDRIYGGVSDERNVNASMAVACVAGMPNYPEGAYELVAPSDIFDSEWEGHIIGRDQGFDS